MTNSKQKKNLIPKISAFIDEKFNGKHCPYGNHIFIKKARDTKQINKTGWKNVGLGANTSDTQVIDDVDDANEKDDETDNNKENI
jgi:hypothetical protein